MAIKQISITRGGNIKEYQCLTTDVVQDYPVDCGPGSTMKVISESTNAVVAELYFDGVGWRIRADAKEFEAEVEIVRPANSTQYAINAIINGDGASTLPELNFGASNAGRKIQINSAALLSENGAALTLLSPIIQLFKASTITGQTLTDGTAFNPSYSEMKTKAAGIIESLLNSVKYGAGFYQLFQGEILRNATLNSEGKLYVALVASNQYTPASGEKITLILKGYLL